MDDQIVIRVVAKLMIPFIVIFGLYVITHGDFGPGGGFQGGVVVAAAFILYGLVFGREKLQEAIPLIAVELGAAIGVFIYAGVGLWNLMSGGNFLDYSYISPHDPMMGEAWGIILVEYGVGITVATVTMIIYYMIAERIGDE